MGLDRLRAEPQRLADALVRAALGHQLEDLALARSDSSASGSSRRCRARSSSTTARSTTHSPAATRRHRVDQLGRPGRPAPSGDSRPPSALSSSSRSAYLGSRCCERTSTAGPRVRARISWAATSPSSVCVGGIRMSTIATSGRAVSTRGAAPRPPRTPAPRRRARLLRAVARRPRGRAWRRRRSRLARDLRARASCRAAALSMPQRAVERATRSTRPRVPLPADVSSAAHAVVTTLDAQQRRPSRSRSPSRDAPACLATFVSASETKK